MNEKKKFTHKRYDLKMESKKIVDFHIKVNSTFDYPNKNKMKMIKFKINIINHL